MFVNAEADENYTEVISMQKIWQFRQNPAIIRINIAEFLICQLKVLSQ